MKFTKPLIFLLLLIPGLVWAEHQQVYFGGSIGSAAANFNEPTNFAFAFADPNTAEMDDALVGFKLYGGMNFDRNLGIDFEMMFTESVNVSDAFFITRLYDIEGFSVSVQLNIPVDDKINLYGKGGAFFWSLVEDFDLEVDSGVNLTYGVGLDLSLDSQGTRAIRFSYDYYDFNDIFVHDLGLFAVGLVFKLGH